MKKIELGRYECERILRSWDFHFMDYYNSSFSPDRIDCRRNIRDVSLTGFGNGGLVGVCCSTNYDLDEPESVADGLVGEIRVICINPSFRKRGYGGRIFVDALCDRMKTGVDWVSVVAGHYLKKSIDNVLGGGLEMISEGSIMLFDLREDKNKEKVGEIAESLKI